MGIGHRAIFTLFINQILKQPFMKITATIIKVLAPLLAIDRAQVIAGAVNESAPLYQINTPQRMAAILSQIAHESGGFTAKSESLNYSEERLLEMFSFYRKYPQLAKEHGRTKDHLANQQLIANTVYADANRSADRKLGNVQPNDGWFFRGAGPMQLTGREVFTAHARYKKVDIVLVTEQLRTSDTWGWTVRSGSLPSTRNCWMKRTVVMSGQFPEQ
jgi:predicted chitinase